LFVLDHDGEPFLKIMDFGIAKQSDGGFDSTSTGKGMGSPAYMSPQQFVDSKRVDARADLWSLGVVAYEALTARKPFHGLDMFTLAMAIAKGVFKMPSTHRADIPKAVDDWMRRALAAEVDQRFSSAKEMADAFTIAIQQPSEVKSKSYAPPSSNPRDALAATVLAPKVQDKPLRRRGDLAKDIEKEVEPERPSKPLIFTPREEPAIEVTEYPTRGHVSITGLPAWLRAVGFSDKSDALLASFGGGEVLCLDLATRRPRFWQRLFSRTYALEATPNAAVIACGDGTVRFLDPASGNVIRTIEAHAGAVRCIAVRRGTLATSGEDKRLTLWNINSGERLFVGVNQAQRIISIAIHSTSGMLVTGGKLGNFRIWDNNARLVRHDDLRCGSIRQVTFTPDGWGLAAACGDGRVRLWETREWSISRIFEDDKKKPVVALAFDTYGQTMVTGSSNGTIRLWNVTTGQLQRVIEGFGESVQDLVMSPDNRYLAISFANGMLQVHKWPLDPRLGEKLFNE
jgi:eukaryotic-like serine/threonine-protein kinase